VGGAEGPPAPRGGGPAPVHADARRLNPSYVKHCPVT
jgi:hypothetical protein